MSRALARPLEMRDLLRRVHREMARVLDVSICLFGVFDPVAQQVEVLWQIHDGQELPGGSFPLGSGFTSQVIRTGHPLLIRDWPRGGPPVQVHYATEHLGLPQSAITVPVRFDERVRGVLSVQSYRPAAFDEDDLALLAAVADQVAVAIFAPRGEPGALPATSVPVESVLASMPVGVLVLDRERRVIQVNQAARRLLCVDGASLILGQPVDQPQERQWPLGSQALTERVRPLLDRLSSGQSPTEEVDVEVSRGQHLACSASALVVASEASGGLLLFRAMPTADAA